LVARHRLDPEWPHRLEGGSDLPDGAVEEEECEQQPSGFPRGDRGNDRQPEQSRQH
jgi:hypothetical protein